MTLGHELNVQAKRAFPEDTYEINLKETKEVELIKKSFKDKFFTTPCSIVAKNTSLIEIYQNLKAALESNFNLGTCGLRCHAAVAAYLKNRHTPQPRLTILSFENNDGNHALLLLGESYTILNKETEARIKTGDFPYFPTELIDNVLMTSKGLIVLNPYRNQILLASDYFKNFPSKFKVRPRFDSLYLDIEADQKIIEEIIDCYDALLTRTHS